MGKNLLRFRWVNCVVSVITCTVSAQTLGEPWSYGFAAMAVIVVFLTVQTERMVQRTRRLEREQAMLREWLG